MRERWAGGAYREAMVGKLRDWCLDNRKEIVERLLKFWADPQARENRAKLSSELWDREEYQKLVSESIKDSFTAERRVAVGVENNRRWQDADYRERIKIAISRTMTELWADEAQRAKWAVGRSKQPRISSLQVSLYEYLDNLGVNYVREGPDTTVGFYVFDCKIATAHGRSLLIECQGDYWHSLPKTIRNDRAKFTYINRYFPEYEIMYIWEHEFSAKDRVLDRLKTKLGIKPDTVDYQFGQLQHARIDRNLSNEFLTKYHYLGASRGGSDYGLWLGDTLIAVSRFGPLPRQNMAHQFPNGAVELARLCVHPNYHKKNLLSWWLARLVKDHQVVVAFADTTVGHLGTVYKASNFKLHHTTQSDYWYADKDGYVMHKKTLYNRAVNLKLTESEFAAEYGYIKKWGGPKLCFLYHGK